MNLENCRYISFWRCPPPLTAHQNNALNVLPTAKNSRTVSFLRLIHSIVALLLCAIKGKSLRDGCFLPLAWNLRTDLASRQLFLQMEDGLLSEQDQELPFTGHVVCVFQHIDFIEHLIMIVLVWAQKIIVSNP